MMTMKESQSEEVYKLLDHCCNYEDGLCLLLGMPCPQRLSLTRINCIHFRKAVLPAFPELESQIKRNNQEEEK